MEDEIGKTYRIHSQGKKYRQNVGSVYILHQASWNFFVVQACEQNLVCMWATWNL